MDQIKQRYVYLRRIATSSAIPLLLSDRVRSLGPRAVLDIAKRYADRNLHGKIWLADVQLAIRQMEEFLRLKS